MTTTDPTAPATPGETLRWAVKRLMARSDAGGMHIAAAWLAVWADELDAARATDPASPPEHQPGARTYELPAEPPPEVTELWDADGDKWDREVGTDRWWSERRGRWVTWPNLLALFGPLSTTPPAGTAPASATAVDLPAGMQP